jgi:Fic family protein
MSLFTDRRIMPFQRDVPYNELPLLPPKEELETRAVLRQVIVAARALAELRGTSARLPNPRVLVNAIVLQEARLSSEVENIVTTSDELYRAAANFDSVTDPQTKEVIRYREALWYGFDQISNRGLTTNLFIDLVGMLRQLHIGLRSSPGTNLKDPFGTVIYTPPNGESLLREMLANLEQYIHNEDGIDPLIKLAVVHYQFEAIHPFTDGNGRTGRILNVLYLVQQRLLDIPVLYLSQYILRNRAAYYAGLRQVTEEQRWEEWVLFLLKGIEETSHETCVLIDELLKLMDFAKETVKLKSPGIYSKDLIEVVFSNPYCRIRFIEEKTAVTRQTASTHLQKLAQLGLLREQRVGREVYYINDRMIQILAATKS